MANNSQKRKNKKDIISIDTDQARFAKYDKSKYFAEKDRKAAEFLKKHPIPADLFTRHLQ